MGEIVSRLFGTYYLYKVRDDSTVLHYKRSPTWRSLVLFTVFAVLTHVISLQALTWYLAAACYVLGLYFCYIATEKYEECVFDKSKGTITLMNTRFLEKYLLGYRKRIVTELSEIVGVIVESQTTMGAKGHQVVLVFLTGLTLSLTAQCTYGNKSEHEAVAREVKRFLDLPSAATENIGSKEGGRKRTKKHD